MASLLSLLHSRSSFSAAYGEKIIILMLIFKQALFDSSGHLAALISAGLGLKRLRRLRIWK
jgi:hypothetical protein